jgi:hypothetical protein
VRLIDANGNPNTDEDLIGAELVFGHTSLGHVLDVRRDPVSQRVWRLIARYGPHGRRVAVPIEWVVRRTPTKVILAVGTNSLDDLPDELAPLFSRGGISRVNGAVMGSEQTIPLALAQQAISRVH